MKTNKVIFCIVLISMMVLLSSCAPADANNSDLNNKSITVFNEDAYGNIIQIKDEEAGVVCWVYKEGSAGGISCLPLKDTKLDTGW
jgi:ABC-type Fe3+-hydroxamate transport system substrate-binding protein